tara:strand:- start:2977 stop:4341 length:1365 start_codon:yes stop_codon:yes gene_type:complete
MSSTINIIDPVYFNNKSRAEFRLDHHDVAYLSSGCYLSLGAHATNALLTEVNYNRRAGVAGLVRSLRLLDGATVLAQLDNAGSWMAFRGLNKDNADAFSKKMMPCSATALMQNGIANYLVQETISTADEATQRGQPGISEATCSLGYIAITEFLKELETLRVLPTRVFTNLRLVVEFSTDLTAMLQQQSSNAGAAVSNLEQVRPILVVESVSDPAVIQSMIADMSNVRMDCIESDQFALASVAAGRQSVSQQLRGFNSKIVNRLLIVNQPTSNTDGILQTAEDGTEAVNPTVALDSGRLNSLVQNQLTINARVNGSNVFQGQGLGFDTTQTGTVGCGTNHRLGTLTDTWGDVAICAGGNSCGLVFTGLNDEGTINNLLGVNMGQFFYGSDYTGFRVMDRVSHLEIDYGRSFVVGGGANNIMNSSTPNQALNVIVYAEIPKVVQIQNGSYRVAYL